MPSSTSPREVMQLVDEQVKRWLAEQAKRKAQPRVTPEPPRPLVTISREAGANGTSLGRAVARKLGFELWDQELVQRVAQEKGAPEALFAAVDERARSRIQDMLAGILMGDVGTETEYLASLGRVIHSIAEHGSAVIVGRGAHFVLAATEALRIRVVAPLEDRVRVIAGTRGLGDREARAELERIDHDRVAFNRHHYGRNVADPVFYDVVVNTGSFPLDSAAEVVVAAYRAKFPAARG
ncbi:MAG TPA: cytidylate kinase-like family protein [Polyangiaceae bacterium]